MDYVFFKNITGGSLNSQGWPWASDRVTIYTGGESKRLNIEPKILGIVNV